MGIFENPFDLNRDGKMSANERVLEFMVLQELMEEERKQSDAFSDSDGDDWDNDGSDW